MKPALSLFCLVVLLSGRGEGCYQPMGQGVRLRSKNVVGLVMVDVKPWAGAHVSLREAPGAYMGNNGKTKFTRELGATVTDRQGVFSFRNVPPGKYTILTEAELTDVELIPPTKDQDDTVWVQFDADHCQRAYSISAGGTPRT